MWATIAKLVGGPLISKGFKWLMGKQEVKKQERALRAEWELEALKKSSSFLRIVSYVTIWGPIYYAFYLVVTTMEITKPEDVATAIQQVFNAFPQWYVVAAVSILLAIWGLKESSVNGISKVVAEKERNRTEAAKELQKRKTKEYWDSDRYR